MLTEPLIEVRAVVKDYGGLRPLRVARLTVAPGELVVLEGFDTAAASVLVDLVTGTTLPDAGEVRAGGVATASLSEHEAWLAFLEQFGIVSERVVLLEELTVAQNLAVPLTLDLDPLSEAALGRVLELGTEVGIARTALHSRLSTVSPLMRFRIRLGRALAHRPRTLLLEHPTMGLPEGDVAGCADAVVAARAAGRAILALSNDAAFASRAATRRLAWTAATGRVEERRGRRWFGA